jgi:hypothetical protein
MVTLQSRWKRNRSWNVRLYVALSVAAVLCVALVFAVKGLIAWVKDVALPAAMPQVARSASEPDSAEQYVGKMVGQFEREFRVSDYTFVLPNDFVLDVLPQPKGLARGGRFTGLRFRVPGDDAAQLCCMVIDYPKKLEEEAEPDIETRLGAALDRLFERISRNAEMVREARGDNEYGELDGMPFARCAFSGDFKNGRRASRVRLSGVALATVAERRDVFLYSLCDSTAHRDDRELLETAVLTLRRIGTAGEADEARPGESEEDESQARETPLSETGSPKVRPPETQALDASAGQ